MANLEIAQIQNAALKAAALEVDESGKKDGYIDSSEINLFTDKALSLLNEKKCTAQEFATLFATNEVDKTNTTDVFAKVDSIHNAKNSPEALAREAEEAKRAEKQEKINGIKAKIANNDEKLKNYEHRLSQKEIAYGSYRDEIASPNRKKIGEVAASTSAISVLSSCVASLLELESLSCILLGFGSIVGVAAMAGFCIVKGVEAYNNRKASRPEEQFKYRYAYKEAYLKVSQENEQLKAQLAELQK